MVVKHSCFPSNTRSVFFRFDVRSHCTPCAPCAKFSLILCLHTVRYFPPDCKSRGAIDHVDPRRIHSRPFRRNGQAVLPCITLLCASLFRVFSLNIFCTGASGQPHGSFPFSIVAYQYPIPPLSCHFVAHQVRIFAGFAATNSFRQTRGSMSKLW